MCSSAGVAVACGQYLTPYDSEMESRPSTIEHTIFD